MEKKLSDGLHSLFLVGAFILVMASGILIINGTFAGAISGEPFNLGTVAHYFGPGFILLGLAIASGIASIVVSPKPPAVQAADESSGNGC